MKNRLRSSPDVTALYDPWPSSESRQSLRRFDEMACDEAAFIGLADCAGRVDSAGRATDVGIETLDRRLGGPAGAGLDCHVVPLACCNSLSCVGDGVKLLGSNSARGVRFALKNDSIDFPTLLSKGFCVVFLRGVAQGVF